MIEDTFVYVWRYKKDDFTFCFVCLLFNSSWSVDLPHISSFHIVISMPKALLKKINEKF